MTRIHQTHSSPLPDPFPPDPRGEKGPGRASRASASPPELIEARKEEREASKVAALLRKDWEAKSRAAEKAQAEAEARREAALEARDAANATPSAELQEAEAQKARAARESAAEAERRRKDAERSEKLADDAERRAKEAEARLRKLEKKSAAATRIDYDYLKDQWKKVSRADRLGSDRAFLRIQARSAPADPLVQRALDRVRKKNEHDEDDALDLIRARGLATEISNVTKRLNQMAMSETRRLVLAATYSDTLYRLIEGGHDDAADTLGFTSAVLHYQESGEDSPLARFAAAVVDIVLAENAVDLAKDDYRRLLMVDELRATF